ncbi:MAG: cation:proton antiporter [Bacteroidales bacterium]
MKDSLNLVSDLALIFISAGLITIIFRKLKQPLILGYIVAGFVIGPHFNLFPNVVNTQMVDQWSEIGIIFLLFGLGLEFSFKKLVKVGSSAIITASTIVIAMFFIGLGIARVLDWTFMESIFLGGMLAMSSTTIIVKAFDDLGLKKKSFTNIVFGALIVEDFMAVLFMVLLSTFAISQHFEGIEMLQNLLKLGVFLIFWFLVGIYVLPTLLDKFRKNINNETLMIFSVGLCFGMVLLAKTAGFSSALGAFVMGSILGETVDSTRISNSLKSIKDLFGAIFFISVGMMVNPVIIIEYWKPILLLFLVVVIGISVFGSIGVVLSGNSIKTGIRSGMSMSQIGEFAFIIAGLGVSLGVMREFIYPIIVSVSVLTTFTTPYMMKWSEPVSNWIYLKLPNRLINHANNLFSGTGETDSLRWKRHNWRRFIKYYIARVGIYSVILFMLISAGNLYLQPFLHNNLSINSPLLIHSQIPLLNHITFTNTAINWISVIITLLFMSPFLWGLAVNKGKISDTYERLWLKKSNRAPLVALLLLRVFIACVFLISVFLSYFDLSHWQILLIILGLILFIIISRADLIKFENLEKRFYSNLNEKELADRKRKPIITAVENQMIGKDIKLETIIVSADSEYIGMQLKDIPFRTKWGINIVKIIRGHKIINIPSANEQIYPFDTLLAAGKEDEIIKFNEHMHKNTADDLYINENLEDTSVVMSGYLSEESYLVGKSIAKAAIRNYKCMILGIERGKESYMNPSPDFVFQPQDKVWMVGQKVDCQWFY